MCDTWLSVDQEKRGHREVRLLEKLNKLVVETNQVTLPHCTQTMHEQLCEALTRRKASPSLPHTLKHGFSSFAVNLNLPHLNGP